MFRSPAPLLLVACLALPAAPAWAQLRTYALDPVHTRVVFAVRHAGFSDAIGTVSGSTGTLRFDPDDWSSASLDVEVPMARVDLGDPAWNDATLGRRLLDAARHPVARFTSTRVEPLAADRARVHGTLELRGIARDVVLEVVLNAHKRHPMPPFRRTAGFSATTALRRADFGLTAWESMIGDTVSLQIEAEATQVRDRGDAPRDGAGDARTPPAEASDARPATDPEPVP